MSENKPKKPFNQLPIQNSEVVKINKIAKELNRLQRNGDITPKVATRATNQINDFLSRVRKEIRRSQHVKIIARTY